MGPAFVAMAWILVVGMAFVPTLVIGLIMLRSPLRAFVLAATFTGGAFAAFVACALLGSWLVRPQGSGAAVMIFATAGAVGGGVLAVYLLGRMSKYPPWRRY